MRVQMAARMGRAELAQLGNSVTVWDFTSKGTTCARAETCREVSADLQGRGERSPPRLGVLHRAGGAVSDPPPPLLAVTPIQ